MKLLVPAALLALFARAASAQVSTIPTIPGSLTDYDYKLPVDWQRTDYPDGIVYASPIYNTGERCQLSVFLMRRAAGDLLATARQVYAEIFRLDPFQNNQYPYPVATVTRGTAAAGWSYLIIQRSIRGQVGDYGSLLGTRILVAQLGDRVGVITTTGKDPEVSNCFGEIIHDEWPAFFYSLKFKTWPGAKDATPRQLAGAWVTATASVADRYVFAANGRFASAAAAMTTTRISPNELLTTTNAYFGDGAYQISGNKIVLTRDNDNSHPLRGFWRIESETQDGVTWKDRLCLLLEGIGEVCYKRDEIQ